MTLNEYRDEAYEFLKSVDPLDEEPLSRILEMCDAEYRKLKLSTGDPDALAHQVYDMLFLLFEMAAKKDLDLDAEWARGRDRKRQKYEERGHNGQGIRKNHSQDR